MASSLRRTFLFGGAIVIFLILAGATYQGVTTAVERRRYPHPGRLLDVGGHQLHLLCEGNGMPVVVLEAPAAAMSSAWALVQTNVAKITRVCSYDRAGLGWSEMGDRPFTPEAVSTELQALLRGGGEQGPFILVGAELGAAFTLLYTSRFPDDTAAIVLVNPPGPAGTAPGSAGDAGMVSASPWLARIGLLRAMGGLSPRVNELPETARGSLVAFLNRPDHLTRASTELSQWSQVVQRASEAPQRRTIPVIQVLVDATDRLTALTSRRNAQDVTDAIVRAVRSTNAP